MKGTTMESNTFAFGNLDSTQSSGLAKENAMQDHVIESMLSAYLETALWTATGEDGSPLDHSHTVKDFAPSAVAEALADCSRFLGSRMEACGGYAPEAGKDLWLTRNRHGAGFWDGDWPEEDAAVLTAAAHAMGEVSVYVGEDGLLYFARG